MRVVNQYLSRGWKVDEGERIQNTVAVGESWQICTTNLGKYVLAVGKELFDEWVASFGLPDTIFLPEETTRELLECRVYVSSYNYLISSISHGPYPNNNRQIEAFSIAFHNSWDYFQNGNFGDAVYLEEYTLLYPVKTPGGAGVDAKILYGKWLTGGVDVSIDSIDGVHRIMSWLPAEELERSVRAAGFDFRLMNDTAEAAIVSEEAIEEQSSILGDQLREKPEFTLVGRPELERFFRENIIDIVLHREQYERVGISFPGATILYGPPGCGKTYAVERLVEYLGWRRFDIDSASVASSYIHDTSKKISSVFQSAIQSAPSVLVIDEMEAFLSNRSNAGPSGQHHIEEVAEFLRRIPEAVSKGVLIFGMTNMIDSIDPAILRRGRFDHIVEVKAASKQEIEALLKKRFEQLPIADDVDASAIADELTEHPLSDVSYVLQEAGRMAVRNGKNDIDAGCFQEALAALPQKQTKPRIGF